MFLKGLMLSVMLVFCAGEAPGLLSYDIQNRLGVTNSKLFSAAMDGDCKRIEQLIARGADVNIKRLCWTPMHVAARNGHESAISTLAKEGANVNAKCSCGRTPTHVAAYWGNEKAISALAKEGADMNAKDSDGHTPMHVAAYSGNKKAISSLAKEGADVNAKDFDGFTPIGMAATQKIRDILKKIDEDRQKVASELRKQTSQN